MRFLRADLELVFALHYERTVARDNTVEYGNRVLQIEKTKWRFSLAGCKVTVYKHADQTISIGYGPHIVGRYDNTGQPLPAPAAASRSSKPAAKSEARGAKTNQLWKCRHCGKRQKASLPSAAWKSPAQQQRDFPTFPQLLLLDK